MDRIFFVLEALSRGSVWIGGAALVGISLLISAEIVMRGLFGFSFGGADELSGYVLACTSAWAFGYTALRGGHIRVDTLTLVLPTRVRRLLDVIAAASLFLFAAFLTYHAWSVFALSFALSSQSATPLKVILWVPQGIWVGGLTVFAAIGLAITVAAAIALARGDLQRVSELVDGPRPSNADITRGSEDRRL